MRVLILGIGGQDGSYLAEQLVAAGDRVFGVTRRPRPAPPGVQLIPGDLLDQASLERALAACWPDEVYNLAAVTSPGGAWGTPQPPLLAEATGVGVVRLLEAVARVSPAARVVHASSSAIHDPHRYGLYGISKRFAHDAVAGYRGVLHCSNAVLYSHTSPRQDPRFLARHICSTLARIRDGSRRRLPLTDPDGRRDWGFAPDFTRALPLIARTAAGDFTVATGETHSVRDFVEVALDTAGLSWADAVRIVDGPPVPVETPADISATAALGWKPETGFESMVRLMVEAAIG